MKRMMALSGLLVAAVAGCRGSLPAGEGTAPAPAQANATAGALPSSSPSALASLSYTDSTGDSLTMTYSFSSPQPARELRQVVSASQGCMVAGTEITRDLVIPFTVSATLNSDVTMNVGFSTTAATLGYGRYEVVYGTASGGYTCQGAVNNNGADVPFSLARRGDTDSAAAWLVLNDAISPAQPLGSQSQIGQVGLAPVLYQGNGMRLSAASGRAACTGSNMQNAPVWLHVGGKFFPSERCGQHYQARG